MGRMRWLPKIGVPGRIFGGGAAFGALTVWSRVGDVQTAQGALPWAASIMNTLFGAGWALTGTFKVVAFITMLGCMYGVKWSADREARKAALAETAKREDIARLPALIRLEPMLKTEYDELCLAISTAERALETFVASNDYWSREQVIIGDPSMSLGNLSARFWGGMEFLCNRFGLKDMDQLNNAEPSLAKVDQLSIDPFNPPQPKYIFHPLSNRAFLSARLADQETILKNITFLREAAKQRALKLEYLTQEINQRLGSLIS